jgi:hypothetical protein
MQVAKLAETAYDVGIQQLRNWRKPDNTAALENENLDVAIEWLQVALEILETGEGKTVQSMQVRSRQPSLYAAKLRLTYTLAAHYAQSARRSLRRRLRMEQGGGDAEADPRRLYTLSLIPQLRGANSKNRKSTHRRLFVVGTSSSFSLAREAMER